MKTSQKVLAANLDKIMTVRGLTKANVAKAASDKNTKLHAHTVKLVLEGDNYAKTITLDSLSIALDLPVTTLLWEAGLDDNCRKIGTESKVEAQDVEYTLNMVDSKCSAIGINDRKWQAKVVSECLMAYINGGSEAADTCFLAALMEYKKT